MEKSDSFVLAQQVDPRRTPTLGPSSTVKRNQGVKVPFIHDHPFVPFGWNWHVHARVKHSGLT